MPYMESGTQVNILSRVDSDAGGINILSRRKTRRLERRAPGRGDQLEGISIKGIKKAIKKVATPVQKVVKKVGHAVGKAATSKIGQAIVGTALAVSGVGIPAAAAIGAAVKGGGALIRPGGNLGRATRAAGQGAIVGAGSAVVGKGVRKGLSLVKREKVPATSTSKLDQIMAKNKLPEVSQVPSSTAVVSREKALKLKALARWSPTGPQTRSESAVQIAERQRQRQKQQQQKRVPGVIDLFIKKTVTAAPIVEELAKELPAVVQAADEKTRKQRERRQAIREARTAQGEVAPAGGAPGGSGGGGGAAAGAEDASSLTSIAANQAAESTGGIADFVKQNPIAVGGAVLALAGAAYAMSRGGGRKRSA